MAEFKKNPEKYIENRNDSNKSEIKELKEDDKKMSKLKCSECGYEQELPTHCGKPMHKEEDQLICWMGSSCGCQPIPEHHGKPMEVIE